MTKQEQQTFGEQAARFSLYAPFVVLAIGMIGSGSRDQVGVAIALFAMNVLLLAAGFCLAIAALLSMRRYGRQRILGRATGGLLLNGIALTCLLLILLPALANARVKSRVVGRWSIQTQFAQAPAKVTLTLGKDGRFTFESASDDAIMSSLSGAWVMTRDRIVGLTVEQVSRGNASAVGKKIGLGTVRSVDDREMVLQTDKGQEVYARVQ